MKEYFYKVVTDQVQTWPASLLRAVLLGCSVIYALIVQLISIAYEGTIFRRHRISKPVISIGNIVMGGTGKTPLVVELAQYLKSEGLKPVILIRGYMDKKSSGSPDSDEAKFLADSLNGTPVIVGRNRVKNAKAFLKDSDADVFLLDDGFQHWRLARDLDIVAINTSNPFGNRHVLPRGILREPLNALRRADVFVLTKIEMGGENAEIIKKELKAIQPEALIAEAYHQPVELIDLKTKQPVGLLAVDQKKVCGFCSIADPVSFENSLKQLNANVIKNYHFIDHHMYSEKDLREINAYCLKEQIDHLITTQKDAVKLEPYLKVFGSTISVCALQIKMEWAINRDKLFKKVLDVVKQNETVAK